MNTSSPYLTASTSASAGYKQASAVPDRFQGTSRAIPGQSVLPPEYQGTSDPDAARAAFSDGGPQADDSEAQDDDDS